MYSVGRAERTWPFEDGLWVGSATDGGMAWWKLAQAGQWWDVRLQRWIARLPGAPLPATSEAEHRKCAAMAAHALSAIQEVA